MNSTYSHCIQCGAKLPLSNKQIGASIPTRSHTISQIDPEVRFCTLRCAARYGVNVARARELLGQDLAHPNQLKEQPK